MASHSMKATSPKDDVPSPDRDGELQVPDDLVVHISPPSDGDAAGALTVNELAQPLVAAGNYLAAVERLVGKDDVISRAEVTIGLQQTKRCLKKTGALIRRAAADGAQGNL